MNSSQYKKNELKKFCATIGFKPSEVLSLIENIDDYYREWSETKVDKNTGEPKKYIDGTIKTRTICPAIKNLKLIQKRIKDKILNNIALPDCVHGGVKKKSNITNAKAHQGKKYQFTTDLQDYYPNISSKQVYETFVNLGFSPHFSHWLTCLTTYKHQLPQGTSTSPHIANIVFLSTDLKLIDFCKLNDITYTRFVDDLTFSSSFDFKGKLNTILEIIIAGGFKISYRKTKYKGNQTITGVNVFLNKIDAPEKIKEKVKIEIETEAKVRPYSIYQNNILKTNKKKANHQHGIANNSGAWR